MLFASNIVMAAVPFTCSGNIYQVQSGQLRIFDPNSSTYVDVGSKGDNYNAIGYNQNDNLIYGIRNRQLIQIDANGGVVDIFDPDINSFAGDMDLNNQLWIRDGNTFTVINVVTQNIDVITVNSSFFPAGSTDIAFVNTSLGDRIVQVGRNTMALYDPVLGTNIVRNVDNLPNEGTTGAIWADNSGWVFFFKNVTPNPRAVLVALGDASGSGNNFSGSHAIGFIDNGSGTDFDALRDVRYSNNNSPPRNFSDCDYNSQAGYDHNVKFICINPKGQMMSDDEPPSFSFSFRARIN